MTQSTARIFISTGEVSGDLQGALLVQALHRQAAARQLSLTISALGGARMAAAGVDLVGDTTSIGSVGIFEALPYLLPTLRLQKQAKAAIAAQPPDLAVLIDYMNPNLAMGQFLRDRLPQVPIVYYIAPQQWVWAFSAKDSERIVRNSDKMLAIFQQEAHYFANFGADVTWVGHPLVDRFRDPPDRRTARQHLGLADTAPVITLLPASRQQEVKYLLPRIFQAAQRLQDQVPDLQFLVPVSQPSFRPIMDQALAHYRLRGQVVEGSGPMAIAAADVAITKSGTANLEIALMNVPQVVTYRLNPLSAWIGQHVLKIDIPFASPVNLLEMRPVVPELLQQQATPAAIAQHALDLLTNAASRQRVLADYASLRATLGGPGVCDLAAQHILDLLESKAVTLPSES